MYFSISRFGEGDFVQWVSAVHSVVAGDFGKHTTQGSSTVFSLHTPPDCHSRYAALVIYPLSQRQKSGWGCPTRLSGIRHSHRSLSVSHDIPDLNPGM